MRNCNILVHSCEELSLLHERVNDMNYDDTPRYLEFEKYFMLKEYAGKCKCKKKVTNDEAKLLVAIGEAYWKSKPADGFGADKMRIWESNECIVLRSAVRTPRATAARMTPTRFTRATRLHFRNAL